MRKSKEIFDPGKILLFAEKLLESALVSLEKTADRRILRGFTKSQRPKKLENLHCTLQDFDDGRLEKEPETDKNTLIQERLNELDEIDNEESHDNDMER